MKSLDAQFIRERITELRMRKNVSEREMSFALGKGHSYIHNIVSGLALPHMGNFLDICDYFEITPFEFFDMEMDDPIYARKVYENIKQLPSDELERIHRVLENVDSEKLITLFKMFVDVLEDYHKNF